MSDRPSDLPIPRDDEVGKARIKVSGVSRNRTRAQFYSLLDPEFYIPGLVPMHPDSHDVATVVAGAKKRFLRKIPEYTVGADFRRFVMQFLQRELQPLTSVPQAYCGKIGGCNECFICTANHPIERKLEYVQALEALHGGIPTKRQRQTVKSFIKGEAYPALKHARWINSRSDAFKVWSGPYFQAIEAKVYELPYFIKHVPVSDRCRFIHERLLRDGMRYYISDYTAFESHMSKAVMHDCECLLYSYMLSGFGSVAQIIEDTLTGVSHLRNNSVGVSVSVEARRMSGDMCTSLGNGFTNLMVLAYVASLHGVDLFQSGVFVEGDDGVFALPTDVQISAAEFAKVGFTIKLVEVRDPCLGTAETAFCGLNACAQTNLRNPWTFLSKFAWILHEPDAKPERRKQLLRAKAMSALSECPHCPIVSVAARRALEKTSGYEPVFILDGYHAPPGRVPEKEPISVETRLAFESLYGIPPSLQCLLEEMIVAGHTTHVTSYIPRNEQMWWFDSALVH